MEAWSEKLNRKIVLRYIEKHSAETVTEITERLVRDISAPRFAAKTKDNYGNEFLYLFYDGGDIYIRNIKHRYDLNTIRVRHWK